MFIYTVGAEKIEPFNKSFTLRVINIPIVPPNEWPMKNFVREAENKMVYEIIYKSYYSNHIQLLWILFR